MVKLTHTKRCDIVLVEVQFDATLMFHVKHCCVQEAEAMEMIRVNIKVTEVVKEWYQAEAAKYGMSMSSMMSYVLTKNYEANETVSLLKDANKLIGDTKANGDMELTKDMMAQMAKMIEAMKKSEGE